MKSFLSLVVKHIRQVYIWLIFILSVLLVVYIFPKEGKFRYEFRKGNPWKHDNLIAPYDFAIYKLDYELKKEKDSIRKNLKPYFNFDSTIGITEISRLKDEYNSKWKSYLYEDSISKIGKSRKEKKIFLYDKKKLESYFDKTIELIQFVYSKGILEYSEDLEENYKEYDALFIIKKNIAEEYDYNEVFTQKKAYEYVKQKLDKKFDKESNELDFIKNITLNQYIQANLIFSKVVSNNMELNMLEDISLTKGLVQKGEHIIFKGEIVDQNKFRKLESLKREFVRNIDDSSNYALILIGQLVLVVISFLIIYLYFNNFKKVVLKKVKNTFFILSLIVGEILLADFIIELNYFSLYIVPFAILPIIIRIFFDNRLALFIHVITILLIGFVAPNSFEFFFLQFVTGMVAVFSLSELYRRGHLLAVVAIVFATYSLLYFGIAVTQEGNISKIQLINFLWFGINSILIMITYPLIYAFERIFGFLSDLSLLELSDSNQALLRKLSEKAPGTFQHSMQVANLAEEAVLAIGGNPLLVRTGALYHDIGKIEAPQYFIENQMSQSNPHEEIEAIESGEIIINHVLNGIEIAKKYKLPDQIIDFIKTHHGEGVVRYFYHKEKENNKDKEVDISKFTYPGPMPYSKETAVLMMADSIEAASRSLKQVNKESISKLVDSIIKYQIQNKMFDNVNITFRDITKVKSIFVQKLMNIYHVRIQYPD